MMFKDRMRGAIEFQEVHVSESLHCGICGDNHVTITENRTIDGKISMHLRCDQCNNTSGYTLTSPEMARRIFMAPAEKRGKDGIPPLTEDVRMGRAIRMSVTKPGKKAMHGGVEVDIRARAPKKRKPVLKQDGRVGEHIKQYLKERYDKSKKETKMTDQPEIIDADTGKAVSGTTGTAIDILRKPYVARVALTNEAWDEDEEDTFDGTLYSYLTDLDLAVNDTVVVDLPSMGLVTAKVRGIQQYDDKAVKWIVDKVDTRAYEEREERRIKAEVLKREIDKKVRSMDEDLKLQMYADKDATFKAMLDEYNSLKS